ncbi:oligosaccharide flippase family protein [Cohnella sp. CFH 77786]|uniref:putative polysaccharide biosynthesis protein n=1 Tax=Cohnella sp. CFH 77786 TaxID=2662265 RepID=UPI001C60A716|nr:oligosaccharide flippase family protein [Cohnella sp. CFH 77786]
MKKDTLLKGTLILAAAALTARALGLFQRVPLEHVLNDQGDIYYGVANNVYLFLLVVATAGLPSALSKMVSERYALGREDEARQIYRAALLFGAAAGLVITLFMLGLAPLIADSIMNEPGAAASIRAIAPSLLLFPVIAMMRGYFQGRQYMSAGGISQIVEQILRVTAAIGIAFTFAAWGWGDESIAAGASFGSVFGSIGAFLVMLYYARKLSAGDKASGGNRRSKPAGRLKLSGIYRELFRLSVPIIFTSVTVQLTYTLDSILIKPLLSGHFAPDTIYMWGSVLIQRAQSIAGIPVILAVALGQSIIPVISSAYATGDKVKVGKQASLAIRIAVFSGMPIVLVMSVGAYSVNALLFSTSEGSPIVAMLTFGTIFQIGMMITNSMLIGIGQPRKATMHVITGMLIKIALSFALAPWLGVYGLILATSFCFIWALGFNILSLKKRTAMQVIEPRRWAGFLATIAMVAGVLWGLEWGVLNLLSGVPDKVGYLLAFAAMGFAAAGLYPTLLVMLNVITREEAESYPRPLRKLLAPLFRIRGSRARGV